MTTNNAILAAALTWQAAGCTPIPVRPDGTKAPAVQWRQLIETAADAGDTVGMFAGADTDGLGIVCGTSSGNLEMLELEGRAVEQHIDDEIATAFADHGMADLWAKIHDGYREQSPSGGLHWLYRVDSRPVHGNTKLAMDADGKVLVETRGQGGYVVVAPSAGRTHRQGAYVTLAGSPDTIPTITADEYDALHAIVSIVDRTPAEIEHTLRTVGRTTASDGLRPGDDYNARTDWADLLIPDGWTLCRQFNSRLRSWTRPGKHRSEGASATTGRNAADNLFVFTTSTALPTEEPISKFRYYALTRHGGDWGAAVRQLRADGYGEQQEISPGGPLVGLIDSGGGGQVVPQTDGTAALDVAPAPLVDVAHAAKAFGPTEDGTAQALAHLHRHQLKYCAQRGKWLSWNGARWEWDDAEVHRQHIKELARGLPEDDGWKAYKKRALSASGTTGIARQAESEPAFAVHIDQLDANPYELNTPHGVVDLRTGTMRAPDPKALHTRTTSVAPDFDRAGERFQQFLIDTFGGDERLQSYVQRLVGISAIGTVLEQLLPFAYGAGANGKSTLIEAVMDALGRGETGYAIAAPAEMLMVRRHSEHPAELAQLAGARLVVCSELEDGAKFAEARIKQLTGRDSVNARFMRGNPFTFTPSHTIWLIGNHKPTAASGGLAFWRRLQLIPFEHVVPEAMRDKRLPEQLKEEAPAILAWIINGAADYMQHGLGTPEAVAKATSEYAADQDTVGRFVAEQCKTGQAKGHVQVAVSRVRDAYERFCVDMGDTPVSARRLTQDLRDRFGIESVKGAKGMRFYDGMSLLADDSDADGDSGEGWWQ